MITKYLTEKKQLYFPLYFADHDRVETGILEGKKYLENHTVIQRIVLVLPTIDIYCLYIISWHRETVRWNFTLYQYRGAISEAILV